MSKWITGLSVLAIGLIFSTRALACNTTNGEVQKIDTDRNQLIMTSSDSGCCTEGKSQATFALKKDTKILVNGKPAQLADLKTGDKVKVEYEKADDVLTVSVTREG
jgi:Cu/Ag efflux protein CusF